MGSPEVRSPGQVVSLARARFASNETRSKAWRKTQLVGLERMLSSNVSRWEEALRADLGKSRLETHLTELGIVLQEVRLAQRRLDAWMRPRHVPVPLLVQPARARTSPEPRGVALVIAPWNYPLQLQLAPVVGAVAAGCTVVMKPSEHAPATAALLAELVPRFLDPEGVHVVTGGIETSAALLRERFDIMFATGSERLGRVVAAAAARHLTPCVLELGGACPVWVDRSANLEVAARRIAWAKLLNAGQTCVAPNHVFVDARVHNDFVALLARSIREQSADLPRLIHGEHLEHVRQFISDGEVVVGGAVDAASCTIEATVIDRVAVDAPSVQNEIFGPVLPVVPLADVQEFIAVQRARPLPLAIYGFAENKRVLDDIEASTSSGAFCRNIAVAQLQVAQLPFGGVGASGYGRYRGRASFDTFSHAKAVLSKPCWPDTMRIVATPISPARWRLLKLLLR